MLEYSCLHFVDLLTVPQLRRLVRDYVPASAGSKPKSKTDFVEALLDAHGIAGAARERMLESVCARQGRRSAEGDDEEASAGPDLCPRPLRC